MRLTLGASRTESNAGTTRSPTKQSRPWNGSRCPIAAEIAVELGVRPQTIEKWMRMANHLVARVIRKMREHGADKRADAYAEPVLRAHEGREPPPDCPATWELAQTADMREDVDETRYLRDPSVANRARLITSTRESLRREYAKLDMLVDEQRRALHAQERQP